jgi:hypothetical protein
LEHRQPFQRAHLMVSLPLPLFCGRKDHDSHQILGIRREGALA